MRAVVFKGVGQVAVEDRPVPKIIQPTDAILKVKCSAICGSDLHWYRGHMSLPTGFIPGHEFVGVVNEVGNEVKDIYVGDTVVASFSAQCGNCFYCKKRMTSCCPSNFLFGNSADSRSIDGGQAEYVRVPYADATLVRAPTIIPENMLILMGDIFPTGYFAASRFLKHVPEQERRQTSVAVVCCGPVGICAIATALHWCDTVFAIDMVPERLAEAERLGAKPLLLTADPAATIMAATGNRGVDVALEIVGTPDALYLCLDLVRPFGSISSVGVQTAPLKLDGPSIYGKNITIAWGKCPVRGIFDEALDCLVKVQNKVAFLCSRTMKMEDSVEAYKLFNERKAHKIILTL
ncbi:unnamed protein product [Clonostachys rosea f. rosea IK726]|uniref:Uncharacterized protein n=2 Tax=Clonostachys rosea f. rosea IK726 TaxID=1349383 RepID=A0ACA9UER4_BIOOC|nr:unnamed protein product [Clonostachys rosea f. rosea IK726]CAG9955458.1 unnamed protein product [Clonostachys rosea f. rosea IK726]